MKFFTMNKSDNNYVNDGILFFAQRIDEMLRESTCHIYKVPVLNTYLLIHEYLVTYRFVNNEVISEKHLDYIFDEFIESFKNDIIVTENIPVSTKNTLIQNLQTSSSIERVKIMHYIFHLLSKYYIWCKEYLQKVVIQEKEKKKIESALRCFLPCLIEGGYDSKYIYYHNKMIFNQKNKTDMECFNEFLNRFDFIKRKYYVYVALREKSCPKDILSNNLEIQFDFDPTEAKQFKFYTKNYILAKMEIEALDKYDAAHLAFERLDLFYKYYNFIGGDIENCYKNKCFVKYTESDYDFIDLKIQKYNITKNYDIKDYAIETEKIISSLIETSEHSFDEINKIISLHNVAIGNTDLSNGFLNLWSILEVIFVSDKNCAKITEIERKIIPILQKHYIKRMFADLRTKIANNISKEEYNDIINSIYGDDSHNCKIARLVLLNEYEAQREKLYDYLVNVPLLRSRISQYNTICKKKQDFKKEIERYTRRITWHLMRLYRTRNAIIHTGETVDNLKTLGEHIHEYVDTCIWEIIVTLSTQKLCTIDNVIINERFIMESIFCDFKNEGLFTPEDVFFNLFC